MLGSDSRFILANSFLSYSSDDIAARIEHVDTRMVAQHNEYSEEAARLLGESQYGKDEFQLHLSRGAQWFAIRENDRIQSICFVYKYFGKIWEIGGVLTLPESRGKGLAKSIVSAALGYLETQGLVPRYQFDHGNIASRRLAETLGLELKLVVEHYANIEQKLEEYKDESA